MDPYEALRNAIVLQAVKDWRDAIKRLRKNPGNKIALAMKEETERFFLSEFFMHLTEVDGDYLLKRLRREG